ncbi:hypothetical protein [Methylosinus sp. H3A]|uniref:hypothetical protein n=1 Tax=Methylosinus sp. H3A TaxID=2785786 RepID=UPI00289E1C6D|nr:hypothetical protein [Methylosinus sp. H3A]
MRISDELGRIDINKAPVETLASLLAGLGAPDAEAARWRSRAGASRPKRPLQRRRKSPNRPKDAISTRSSPMSTN